MLNKLLMIMTAFAFLAFDVKSQTTPVECAPADTSYDLPCMKQQLDLAGSPITIKVFTKTKPGKEINRTFVVVHNNEEKGLDAAKRVISENYGRLVEVVSNFPGASNNPDDNKKRYLYFGRSRKCIDPNRIYTVKGINSGFKEAPCKALNPSEELIGKILSFGKNLLNIVTDNNKYKFIIGVHNNDAVPEKLSLNFFTGGGKDVKTAMGIFKANVPGTKDVVGIDNFILVSNAKLFGKVLDFADLSQSYAYNVALQKERKHMIDAAGKLKTALDDGSMSIYFGAALFGNTGQPFDYINIEALGKKNTEDADKDRQRKVIELVITNISF